MKRLILVFMLIFAASAAAHAQKDSSQMFTHLYLGNRTPQSTALCARFGIQGILANFLIDKNRKIVAVNLRGEALAKKMAELLKPQNE